MFYILGEKLIKWKNGDFISNWLGMEDNMGVVIYYKDKSVIGNQSTHQDDGYEFA